MIDDDISTALASAAVPVAVAPAASKTKPEFYMDVVVRSGLDVSVADAITAGELERTMDGASTLTLTLHDPHRALLRNPDLGKAIDMRFAGYTWRLVKVSKSGDALTLTFEDRDVAYLRAHDGARSAKREKVTRAEFIRQLVREVGHRPTTGKPRTKDGRVIDYTAQRPITFVCPELHRAQPIAASDPAPSKRTDYERDEDRNKGINANDDLTVKGRRATLNQRRNGVRVLDVADKLNAGPKATLALMEAVIVESQVQNLTHGLDDSIGILQLRVSLHGRAVSSSIEKSVHAFLVRGFTGRGGAMDLARSHSGWTAAQVAQAVQGSGVPGAYATVRTEAQEWIDAYGGASGTDTGGSSRTASARAHKKYQFRRGEPGKPENSWTAIQRLAEEVNWHAFMDRGRLYYVSDDWLMKQKARFVIDEDDDGVDEINFDIDAGKVSSEVVVTAHAAKFQVPVGCIVRVRKCGIADGRYIVRHVRQSIYARTCEITLSAKSPKLAEPAAETATRSRSQGDGTTDDSLREKIVAVAEASRASYNRNPGAWFYSQSGGGGFPDPTKPPPRGSRSDCSQWVAAVFKKAGAPAPGPSYSGNIWTGNMRVKGHEVSLSRAQPGDVILYGPAPSHHVELFVGPGSRTIGHGSAPVDYGTTGMQSDPHCWRYDFLD